MKKVEKIIIGTDASLTECNEQGYLQLEYTKGDKFSPEKQYRVFRTIPEDIAENLKKRGIVPGLMVDTFISVKDAIEIYQRHKVGIDGACGEVCSENPSDYTEHYDLLRIADLIDMYKGLD